jgi:hypothetical protein
MQDSLFHIQHIPQYQDVSTVLQYSEIFLLGNTKNPLGFTTKDSRISISYLTASANI